MPQDRRRSISYRSFVTCDDPKGVECGAIRKSRVNNSHKKQKDSSKVEADRKQGNHQTNSAAVAAIKEDKDKKEMGVKGITRTGLETPVSFQLLEVSKEAEKLNHVISSWSSSNHKSVKRNQNDDIAKDLLKGALDLQDSLVMLGKLQEASSYVLGLSRKQKQKLEDRSFDDMVSGVEEFPRPMIHVDEYPRKSVDEMKNVVRDSLLRQKMITNPIFEEHYDHRRMALASPDMLPSTSSSTQSSMVYSSNFVSSDSFVSSSTTSQRKKGKNSNLIVKLMGLESFPSSPRKHAEREKILNLAKTLYDLDSPTAKRPEFAPQEVNVRQRSVEEILDKLKFKGILRYSSVNDDLTTDSLKSETFSSKIDWIDERPPIVVMKPMRYPCIDLDHPFNSKFLGERIMKPRYSRESAQEILRSEAVNFSARYELTGAVDCEEKAKSIKKVVSSKVKGSVNLEPKPPKKQNEVKKASEVDKATPSKRKDEQKKDVKSSEHSSSRDQEKLSTEKIKSPKDGKSISKNQTSNQLKSEKTTSTSMLDRRKRGTSDRKTNRQPALVVEEKQICRGDSNDSKKCQIQIRDFDTDSQLKLLDDPEQISYLPNDKKISHYDDNQSSYSEITSVSTSEYCNVDQLGEIRSPLHEVTLITTHENGIAVHHASYQDGTKILRNGVESTDNGSLGQCFTPSAKLKEFLLSNTMFVRHVEELFNIQVNPDSVPRTIDDDNNQYIESPRLLIECANEVLDLINSQFLQVCLPIPSIYIMKSRSFLSLDRLLEEVCNGIEDLRHYSTPVSDDLPSDDIYISLDRDLRFKSGTWEVGWKSMYTTDEVEKVIGEVDKFVLGKLIEDVLSDFML